MDITPKKIEGAKIEGLKETPYLKLLRYAFDKAATGSSFTKTEACQQTSLSSDDFDILKDDICVVIPGSATDYSITQPALINYLQFVQFEDARAHAVEANRQALIAVRLAIAAIIVSILVAIPSIIPLSSSTSLTNNMKLDQSQLEKITNTIEGSKLSMSDIDEIKGTLANIKTAVESQNQPARQPVVTRPR